MHVYRVDYKSGKKEEVTCDLIQQTGDTVLFLNLSKLENADGKRDAEIILAVNFRECTAVRKVTGPRLA